MHMPVVSEDAIRALSTDCARELQSGHYSGGRRQGVPFGIAVAAVGWSVARAIETQMEMDALAPMFEEPKPTPEPRRSMLARAWKKAVESLRR